MASKRQRGSTWHYVVKRKGKLDKPLYFTFDSEAEGDRYVEALERTLDGGVIPPDLVKVAKEETVATAIDEYLAAVAVSQTDRDLLPVVKTRYGDVKLSAITYPWTEATVTAMKREQGLSPSTIRHYIGALARCLDWCARSGKMPINPIRTLPKRYSTYTDKDGEEAARNGLEAREDQERDRRLAPEEEKAVRAILAGQKPEGRERAFTLNNQAALIALFDLLLETGMRLREAYTLDCSQVDIQRKTIFLEKTKNGSKRQVPLSTKAIEVLRNYNVESGLLFPWWDGDTSADALKKVTTRISRQFGRIFDAARCPDFTLHDCRHEFTSRLYERTQLSDLEIAKILGWKSLKLALRYANLRASNLAPKLW